MTASSTIPVTILPAQTRVGAITLLARDLPRLAAFYTELLGLQTLSQTAGEVLLGVQGQPLLRLQDAAALPAPARSRPGLYHTAFLLPTRADLGRWVAHAARLGLRLGSGDHLVSEAFYLNDPEGNGIEVYADRPRHSWTWHNGQVQMDTLAVDVGALLAAAGLRPEQLSEPVSEPYQAPADLQIGHIHLKVGNAAQAAQFYRDALGLDLVSALPGASFMSWGGYHHHVGLNEWESRGQPQPAASASGLGEIEFVTPDLSGLRGRPDVTDHGDHLALQDPWGNRITVRQG